MISMSGKPSDETDAEEKARLEAEKNMKKQRFLLEVEPRDKNHIIDAHALARIIRPLVLQAVPVGTPIRVAVLDEPKKPDEGDLRQKYLGVLGLLANISVHVSNKTGEAEEYRALILEALEDAKAFFPKLRIRQILNRFEIEVLP